MSGKLCVIGDPIGHSKSPLIQNAMLRALGLDYEYTARQVPSSRVSQWLATARAEGVCGFNATMPHKRTLVPLMDTLSADAKLYQSVNTVCIKDGKLYGYNTDGMGFLQSLRDGGVEPEGLRVMVLGAGGAAQAVCLKLAASGAESVTVCNRTKESAQRLCREDPCGVLRPEGFDGDTLRRMAKESDLLVNCTSLGMTGTDRQFTSFDFLAALPTGAAVYDCIYSPTETVLLKRASEAGHPAMNGLGMLIHQGIFALEYFTDTSLDHAAMRLVALNALEGVE